jgi:hypothetical protein
VQVQHFSLGSGTAEVPAVVQSMPSVTNPDQETALPTADGAMPAGGRAPGALPLLCSHSRMAP